MELFKGNGINSGLNCINEGFKSRVKNINDFISNVFRVKSSTKKGKFIHNMFHKLHIVINRTRPLGKMFTFMFELFNMTTGGKSVGLG